VSTLTVATFLGLLALAALILSAGTAGLWALARAGVAADAWSAARGSVAPAALWLGLAVSATATAGSLYFSEVAGFVPCALCWYQRIAMYPLVVILGIAAARGDVGVARYAAPLAAIGATISIWHIGVERIPGLPSGSCSLDVPCSTILVQVLGFVTIPTMALAAFVAILTLLLVTRASTDQEPEPHA
jgi:disulfide bond formation protein DsbB